MARNARQLQERVDEMAAPGRRPHRASSPNRWIRGESNDCRRCGPRRRRARVDARGDAAGARSLRALPDALGGALHRRRHYPRPLVAGAVPIGSAEVAKVNLPVAALIWLMIVPMLLKIDIGALHQVKEHWRGIGVTLFVNWAVKPFSMALLG